MAETGPGYRDTGPGGSPETNSEMTPFRLRGRHLTPGRAYDVSVRDPVIADGISQREYSGAAVASRIAPPRPYDGQPAAERAAELERTEWFRGTHEGMRPGLLGTALAESSRTGQALHELIADVDENGRWYYADALYVEHWQIKEWIENPRSGELLGAKITSRTDTAGVDVAAEHLFKFTKRDRQRNHEGESDLRPLIYPNDLKRSLLLLQAKTIQAHGAGRRKWKKDLQKGRADEADRKRTDDELRAGSDSYVEPEGWEMTTEFPSSSAPDVTPAMVYLDGQSSRRLGTGVDQMSASPDGSRALAQTVRAGRQAGSMGELVLYAVQFQKQIIRRLWVQNGWPIRRANGSSALPYLVFHTTEQAAEKWARIGDALSKLPEAMLARLEAKGLYDQLADQMLAELGTVADL